MKLIDVNFKSIFFVVVFLGSCSRDNTAAIALSQSSVAGSISAYQQILQDRENNSTRPPNDPSVCGYNPKGYLNLKIGNELFRTDKDSAIFISAVVPDHMRENKKLATDIPEGCEGNPYIYPDALIEIRHKPEDPSWQKMIFDSFLITFFAANDFNYVNLSQKYNEEEFNSFKKDNSKMCDTYLSDIELCGWKDEHGNLGWPRVYRANNYTVFGHLFVLNCVPYVAGSRCQAVHQLYPGIYLDYKFIPKKNEHWDEKNIILFDKYLRNLFESIHVKN